MDINYNTTVDTIINRLLRSKGATKYDSIYEPVRMRIKNKYKDQLKAEYDSVVRETGIPTRFCYGAIYKELEKRFRAVIDFSFVEDVFKTVNTIDKLVSKNPKIEKRKTIDNKSIYWNILTIYLPIISLGNYKETFLMVKRRNKELINFLMLYITSTDRELSEKIPYLKIDKIVLTRDFLYVVQMSYKHDDESQL